MYSFVSKWLHEKNDMISRPVKRIVIVYMLLLPVMYLLTETVWGGLHGALAGLAIAKASQGGDLAQELSEFMKKHDIREPKSRDEAVQFWQSLSPEEKAEFETLVKKSVNLGSFAGFGSTFGVCLIVFGFIGIVSGIFTRTWKYVGILPLISFVINNPIIRFGIIKNMPVQQKIIVIAVAQFGASYLLAYLGGAGSSFCKGK